MTRTGLALSLDEFAERFHIPAETLHAWETARAPSLEYAVAYVRTIAPHADLVAEVLT